MRRGLLFLWMIVMTGFASGKIDFTNLPEAPSAGIFDPDKWLTVESKNVMSQNIAIAREKWGSEVFVVILPKQPELGGEVLAKKLGREWGKHQLWGLLLHVVGDPESPRFFGELSREPGWKKEQLEDFKQSIDRALSEVEGRAKREENQRLKVESGTRELTDELGYLGLVMSRIDRNYDQAKRKSMKQAIAKSGSRDFLQKFLLVLVPLMILIGGVLVHAFFKMKRERKQNYYFPETSPLARFQAPWAGGGNALFRFTSKIGKDGSRKG